MTPQRAVRLHVITDVGNLGTEYTSTTHRCPDPLAIQQAELQHELRHITGVIVIGVKATVQRGRQL